MTFPVLVSRCLEKAGVRHAFTTRAGGVSEAPYESLDFAILRDPERLRENQRRLAAAVGFDASRLFQTMQVHGKTLVVAGRDGDPASFVTREADALVADAGSNDAVAVRVADCVPVLLAHANGRGRVAAAHAGWRGAVAGVVGESVAAIDPSGGRDLVAAIGPCIGACCFEVGADVATEIARVSEEGVIVRRVGEKAFVDLRRAVRVQLVALGVPNDSIDDVGGCTRCDAARFYSYRRDGDLSGRLLAVIVPN